MNRSCPSFGLASRGNTATPIRKWEVIFPVSRENNQLGVRTLEREESSRVAHYMSHKFEKASSLSEKNVRLICATGLFFEYETCRFPPPLAPFCGY